MFLIPRMYLAHLGRGHHIFWEVGVYWLQNIFLEVIPCICRKYRTRDSRSAGLSVIYVSFFVVVFLYCTTWVEARPHALTHAFTRGELFVQ